MSCMPTLSANGPYKSKVSFDFCICLFLGTYSMVLILCSLSHNLTKITLTSFAIANAIFWRLLAFLSATFLRSIFPNLLTPSTICATSSPNILARLLFWTLQSSSTSCINAAHIESQSILSSSNISVTATGWVI